MLTHHVQCELTFPHCLFPNISTGAQAGPTGFTDFGDFGGVQDIFETFFGGSGGGSRSRQQRRTGPVPGEDLRLNVEVDFKKAAFGGEQKIRFTHLQNCTTCGATGVKPGTSPRTCGTCGGNGVVVTVRTVRANGNHSPHPHDLNFFSVFPVDNFQVARTPLGAFQQQSPCPDCRGSGEIVDEYCGTCSGRGRLQTPKQLVITIPAGVDTGSRLRVRGEGDAGLRGGPAGDLFVVLTVKRDARFKREGQTVYTTLQISYIDALLGKKVPVETIDGEVMLTVPAGTQPAKQMRIAGKGIPKLGGASRGDHIVTVNVSFNPEKLTP